MEIDNNTTHFNSGTCPTVKMNCHRHAPRASACNLRLFFLSTLPLYRGSLLFRRSVRKWAGKRESRGTVP